MNSTGTQVKGRNVERMWNISGSGVPYPVRTYVPFVGKVEVEEEEEEEYPHRQTYLLYVLYA